MNEWKKIKIGEFLIKESTRLSDIDDQPLEVYGVSNVLGITKTSHKQSKDLSKYILIKPGFFAYNPYRINVGSIGLTPDDINGVVSPAYVVFRADKTKLLPELLLDFLKSNEGLFEIKRHARGTVRQALRFEDLCKIEMVVPPIEYQKEIIKKRNKTQIKYKELKFKFKTQKITLQKLRQSILQDAIEGKLTTDWRKKNSNVEPASELLKKIKVEKEKLIAEKKIKKEKPLPEISKEEIPFELPKGWEWCRLGSVILSIIGGGTPSKSNLSFWNGKIPWASVKDLKSKYLDDTRDHITNDAVKSSSTRIIPSGNIILCTRMGLGKIVINRKDIAINQDLKAVFLPRCVDINYFFNTYKTFKVQGTGMTVMGIRQEDLMNYLIPLPSSDEQKAIVEKVEILMQKLDKLEIEISQNQKTADMLMQAVLKEAFEK